MATIDEWVSAFQEVVITSGQEKMLCAHYLAPDQIITSTQLATAANYKGYQAANLWYGKLGKAIALKLNTTPDHSYDDGTPIWTFMLADGWRTGYENEWEWRLRPEVAKAIELIGIVS
jgi:predicted HNH restriction endonuclease